MRYPERALLGADSVVEGAEQGKPRRARGRTAITYYPITNYASAFIFSALALASSIVPTR